MHPTVDLFFFELPSYTALVMLGCAAGLITAYLYLRWRRVAGRRRFLDAALVVFVAAWLGGRAYHVALNWDYYAARPDEIAQFGLGGLALRGAFIAGALALVAYARVRGVSFTSFADASALGLCSGQAIGWYGALVHGANYGVVSENRFALDLADLYGLIQPRFPLQHIEIVLFITLFIGLLMLASRKPRAGVLCVVYLLGASSAQFILGFQRGDATVRLGAWRVDQLVDVGLILLALVLGARQTLTTRSELIAHVETH
ncbi:MAG: prolipoprotein diacylglyceryl transferase [Chloroflexi bacterium]|nr:prolipoprotein diacylglyceryl transferase [Chloroflexota bacterium]